MTAIRDRGFALPLVIWALLILGGLATGAVDAARSDLRTAASRESVAQARAAADGGIALAVLLLDRAIAAAEPPPSLLACAFAGHALFLEIEDEAGKIDLNRAEPPVMAALLATLSMADAAGLAERVADFRDPDDLRRPSGAEGADYRRMGADIPPRNGPLLSLDDLRAIPGGREMDISELSRHATVHGVAGVDSSVASGPVAQALRSVSARPRSSPSRQRTFTVRVSAVAEGGAAFRRDAILRVGRPVLRDIRVLEWRRRPMREVPRPESVESCQQVVARAE